MPSVISESDLFAATIQRPNNGESADAASILLFAQHFANSRRYTYNRLRTRLYDVTRAPYNCDSSGTADSTAGIQAAIDEASAVVGGGDVFLPGHFRHTGLTCRPGVNLRGIENVTLLDLDHSSNNCLTWDNGSAGRVATVIENVQLAARVNNTGAVIYNPSPTSIHLKLLNCALNSGGGAPLFKGRMVFSQGAGSVIKLEECYLDVRGDASADGCFMGGAGSELWLSRSRFVMPATYSSNLVQMDDGVLRAYHSVFDVTAHSGSADVINLLSFGYHILKGNEFYGAFSSGACITAAGGKVSETGSVFDTVNGYDISGLLALGSELTLQNPIASTIFSGSALNCATGYRAQSFNHHGAAPTVTLPAILFIGQEFDLTIFNNSGSGWAGIALTSAINGLAGSVPTGQARTFKLKALDIKATGSPFWVCMGDASSAAVVP